MRQRELSHLCTCPSTSTTGFLLSFSLATDEGTPHPKSPESNTRASPTSKFLLRSVPNYKMFFLFGQLRAMSDDLAKF